ncbi:hypothetical protein DT019_30495 [Streptomyces sp. SDr-06]|nr:hypothetical protein DT019_30495 [Streptomyces sp. SDr-06]
MVQLKLIAHSHLTYTRFMVPWRATATASVIQGWTLFNADPRTPRAVCSAFEQFSDWACPHCPR